MAFIKFLILSCLIYEICAKYNIEIRKFEVMPETDPAFLNFGTLRIIKKSRTEVELSGTYYLFKKLTNVGQFAVTVYRLNTMGVAQLKMLHSSGGFCDQIAKNPTIYNMVLENSDMPANYCPFPAGNYTVHNFVIHMEKLPQVIPPGEYMCTAVYSLNGVIKFGYKFSGGVTNE